MLRQSLPLVLELSLEASQSCSFALLDQLNFPEGIALSVQLLLWQHQPSPAVRQLLSRGIEQGTDDCVAVVVWTTALSAIQVHVLSGILGVECALSSPWPVSHEHALHAKRVLLHASLPSPIVQSESWDRFVCMH